MEEINRLEDYLKAAGSEALLVTTVTRYRQIKSYTEQLINTHTLTHTHTHSHPSQVRTQYTPTFNHPVGMCFSSSFEAEIFELHESSYEVLPRGSTELLRPSDNNSRIPRIQQGQKTPTFVPDSNAAQETEKKKKKGQTNGQFTSQSAAEDKAIIRCFHCS